MMRDGGFPTGVQNFSFAVPKHSEPILECPRLDVSY